MSCIVPIVFRGWRLTLALLAKQVTILREIIIQYTECSHYGYCLWVVLKWLCDHKRHGILDINIHQSLLA